MVVVVVVVEVEVVDVVVEVVGVVVVVDVVVVVVDPSVADAAGMTAMSMAATARDRFIPPLSADPLRI